MKISPKKTSRLLLPLTLGLCLGLGASAMAWALHRGVEGRLTREIRGRVLVSEDGALNIIARASGKGHTRANKEAAVAQIKRFGCPFPKAPHSLWVLDEQDKSLVLCGGENVTSKNEDLDLNKRRTDPEGMLEKADAAKFLSRIHKEGFGRHPPLHPQELEVTRTHRYQLQGRMFDPWRWVVGTTLNIEWIRQQGRIHKRRAALASWGGAGLALLCALGLVVAVRRRQRS